MNADAVQVAQRTAEALEACGARYVIGGSLASSICGEPRSTLDIDMLLDLAASKVEEFVDRLGDAYYADVDAIRSAIERRGSANILHHATSLKVDLFVMGGTPLDHEQMARRRRVLVSTDPERFLYVYTPEDILLQKLRGLRRGGETSDRRWRDVAGIVRVQAERLDEAYLRRGAAILGVEDLLARALNRPWAILTVLTVGLSPSRRSSGS